MLTVDGVAEEPLDPADVVLELVLVEPVLTAAFFAALVLLAGTLASFVAWVLDAGVAAERDGSLPEAS